MTDHLLRILHIDPVKEWRGGQQQLMYLNEGLINQGYHSVVACPPDSELAAYCDKNSLPFYSKKMRGEWDISSAVKLAGIVKKEKFNILHLHSAPAVTLGLFIKRFVPEVNLIATRRVDFSVRKPIIGAWKYNHKYLDRVVCISKNIKRVMIHDGVAESKLDVIEDGIDVQKFEKGNMFFPIRSDYNIPDDHVIIGTVAALVGHKDYPNLLRAAKLVADSEKKVRFLALGIGSKLEELQQMVNDLSINDYFIFCGFKKDVISFLRQLDIFVLASKMEGMGTSILDAQACGLPVVGTQAGGIPEIIKHEQNGLLVPKENPNKLAQALLKLIREPQLRRKYGAKSREYVKNFDKIIMIQKNLELYKTLINEENNSR